MMKTALAFFFIVILFSCDAQISPAPSPSPLPHAPASPHSSPAKSPAMQSIPPKASPSVSPAMSPSPNSTAQSPPVPPSLSPATGGSAQSPSPSSTAPSPEFSGVPSGSETPSDMFPAVGAPPVGSANGPAAADVKSGSERSWASSVVVVSGLAISVAWAFMSWDKV